MRSRFFLKLETSRRHDESTIMHRTSSPYHVAPAHSPHANSSFEASSSSSSPITSTLSSRSHGHSRWPSSSSSLASTVESSMNAPMSTALHDLVEDPAEREDNSVEISHSSYEEEPFCMCDTPLCEHRQSYSSFHAPPLPSPPEWLPAGQYFSTPSRPPGAAEKSTGRRISGDAQAQGFTLRLSRRFPSFSRRRHASEQTSSVPPVSPGPSAPPSRTASLRLPSIRSSVHSNKTVRQSSGPVSPPLVTSYSDEYITRQSDSSFRQHFRPANITVPAAEDDAPIERAEARTPLLPPMIASHFTRYEEPVQSPLQSPTVASPSNPASMFGTPTFSPFHSSMLTPPLSTKASNASLHNKSSSGHFAPSSDIPPLAISDEDDPWAHKLGHANFHILPAPYLPTVCTPQTCIRLRDDWETARIAYLRQAARIAEHYGPTSQTFAFTAQKWAEIDASWRAFHEQANSEAEINSQSPEFQPLADSTRPIGKMPSLGDTEKFPVMDNGDIVGPMVQVEPIVKEQSKPPASGRRPTFLKLFTDPASLLGGRNHFSNRWRQEKA